MGRGDSVRPKKSILTVFFLVSYDFRSLFETKLFCENRSTKIVLRGGTRQFFPLRAMDMEEGSMIGERGHVSY